MGLSLYILANWPWQKVVKIQGLVAKVATFVPIWWFFPWTFWWFLYPRPNEVWRGYIGISGWSGGWSVGWAFGPLQILRRELLPQFLTDSYETWHRCVPWVVDVQDTFFDSTRKYVAMVTAYYWQKWVQILRRELLPQFSINFHEIWYRCSSGVVNVQDTNYGSGKKCIAMVMASYGQNGSRTPLTVYDHFF